MTSEISVNFEILAIKDDVLNILVEFENDRISFSEMQS